VAVAVQEARRRLEGRPELGPCQLELGSLAAEAVAAAEALTVKEQAAVQGSPAESVEVVDAAGVAVPEDEIFEPLTAKQYIARFHRTLCDCSLRSSGSNELPYHQL
jgi:hypothetical protein